MAHANGSSPRVLGVIETDFFCPSCGYNLHSQKVLLDDRLQIAITQCPECGRHHPATSQTSANSVWLRRLGTVALIVWVLVLLWGVGMVILFSTIMQVNFIDSVTILRMETLDGRLVESRWVDTQRVFQTAIDEVIVPEDQVTQRVRWRSVDEPAGPANHDILDVGGVALLGLLLIALTAAAGVAASMVVWHWRRSRRLFIALMPLLVGLFVSGFLLSQSDYRGIARGPWFITAAALLALQTLVLAISLFFGLNLARLIARLFIPPRPRQFLAFLWIGDGLPPPSIASHLTSPRTSAGPPSA